MYRVFSLLLVIGIAARAAHSANPLQGHWEGTLVREGATLPVSFDFSESATGLNGQFNSPEQRALGIPLRNVSDKSGQAHFELVGDRTTILFDGTQSAGALTGSFREDDAKGSFSLHRAAVVPAPYEERQVRFSNGPLVLSGTLLKPRSRSAVPAVLFLQGSGPESRAGSHFLADYLARRGIAALIYDKRGVGQSSGDWKGADFADLADDAIAGINLLARTPGIDPKHIGVYGHSQGGMLGPFIATRSDRVAFLISGAGGGMPVKDAEVFSVTNQLIDKGVAGEDLVNAKRVIALYLNAMADPAQRPAFWAEAERWEDAKWFGLLFVPPKDHWAWSYYPRIYSYDSTAYWKDVKIPVLVIYGERDRYVPIGPSIANISRALSRGGNKDYTILILPRADHAFNVGPEAEEPFDWNRLSPGYPELLVAWIRERMIAYP